MKFTKEEKTLLIFLFACILIASAVKFYLNFKPRAFSSIAPEVKKIDRNLNVNINKAGMRQLMELPHVGPVLAERIISYRQDNGEFNSKEDLKNIKGIGKVKYELIKEYIILDEEP